MFPVVLDLSLFLSDICRHLLLSSFFYFYKLFLIRSNLLKQYFYCCKLRLKVEIIVSRNKPKCLFCFLGFFLVFFFFLFLALQRLINRPPNMTTPLFPLFPDPWLDVSPVCQSCEFVIQKKKNRLALLPDQSEPSFLMTTWDSAKLFLGAERWAALGETGRDDAYVGVRIHWE